MNCTMMHGPTNVRLTYKHESSYIGRNCMVGVMEKLLFNILTRFSSVPHGRILLIMQL